MEKGGVLEECSGRGRIGFFFPQRRAEVPVLVFWVAFSFVDVFHVLF